MGGSPSPTPATPPPPPPPSVTPHSPASGGASDESKAEPVATPLGDSDFNQWFSNARRDTSAAARHRSNNPAGIKTIAIDRILSHVIEPALAEKNVTDGGRVGLFKDAYKKYLTALNIELGTAPDAIKKTITNFENALKGDDANPASKLNAQLKNLITNNGKLFNSDTRANVQKSTLLNQAMNNKLVYDHLVWQGAESQLPLIADLNHGQSLSGGISADRLRYQTSEEAGDELADKDTLSLQEKLYKIDGLAKSIVAANESKFDDDEAKSNFRKGLLNILMNNREGFRGGLPGENRGDSAFLLEDSSFKAAYDQFIQHATVGTIDNLMAIGASLTAENRDKVPYELPAGNTIDDFKPDPARLSFVWSDRGFGESESKREWVHQDGLNKISVSKSGDKISFDCRADSGIIRKVKHVLGTKNPVYIKTNSYTQFRKTAVALFKNGFKLKQNFVASLVTPKQNTLAVEQKRILVQALKNIRLGYAQNGVEVSDNQKQFDKEVKRFLGEAGTELFDAIGVQVEQGVEVGSGPTPGLASVSDPGPVDGAGGGGLETSTETSGTGVGGELKAAEEAEDAGFGAGAERSGLQQGLNSDAARRLHQARLISRSSSESSMDSRMSEESSSAPPPSPPPQALRYSAGQESPTWPLPYDGQRRQGFLGWRRSAPPPLRRRSSAPLPLVGSLTPFQAAASPTTSPPASTSASSLLPPPPGTVTTTPRVHPGVGSAQQPERTDRSPDNGGG